MRVLSLFDGISCARVALDRVGLPVSEYLASEIDKHAIAVSTKNYPDITRLGDVREVKDVGPIDLLIGGSPCQDLSIAKKGRKGLDGDRSGLFWEYVRILEEVKPTYFILENVASMPKADKAIITETLGVEPVMIDAALVSAQSRKRLFWTNLPQSGLPADRGILLKDILQPDAEVDPSMVVNGKSFCLTASYYKAGTGETETEHNKARKQRTMVKVGHIGTTDGQANRVYDSEGKSATLSANGGGSGAKTGLYAVQGITSRSAGHKAYFGREGTKANCLTTSLGAENLIVRIPEATKQGYAVARPGDSVDLSFPNSTTRRGRVGQKAKNLMTGSTIGVLTEALTIRKLTPIECERLQGLPDGYTDGVAKTHRYKALGNGFNVDVIAHLLTPLRNPS
jgi:DNA (cytosine-5)-methyltransferase 3A